MERDGGKDEANGSGEKGEVLENVLRRTRTKGPMGDSKVCKGPIALKDKNMEFKRQRRDGLGY